MQKETESICNIFQQIKNAVKKSIAKSLKKTR